MRKIPAQTASASHATWETSSAGVESGLKMFVTCSGAPAEAVPARSAVPSANTRVDMLPCHSGPRRLCLRGLMSSSSFAIAHGWQSIWRMMSLRVRGFIHLVPGALAVQLHRHLATVRLHDELR